MTKDEYNEHGGMNMLEFFKESSRGPKFIPHQGQNKIFFHTYTCEEDFQSKAYSMDSVNDAFERKKDPESLLSKMIIMLHELNESVHTGIWDKKKLGKYEHAETDYPKIYKIVLEEISDGALENIANHKLDFGLSVHPSDLGKTVAQRIKEDRVNKDLMESLDRELEPTFVRRK